MPILITPVLFFEVDLCTNGTTETDFSLRQNLLGDKIAMQANVSILLERAQRSYLKRK